MIPRIRFAHLPTPLEPMQRLSAALGGPRLWIKRDDLTGVALGGNKTRKLEYVLAEALANGAKTLVTVGAVQSNHCRQTAALAARLGLRCVLVLSGSEPDLPNGNLLLDRLFGAHIVWAARQERDQVLQRVFNEEWEMGRRPFLIPLGASTAIGALGYVTAIEELLAQTGEAPDWILLGSSSGGTQAGLVLGAKRTGVESRILGISIDQPENELQNTVARIAGEASERLGEPVLFRTDEILVNDDYLGGGYGVLGTPEIEAIRLFAENEGILLGPVYTARAAAGMIDLIRKRYFKENETVLFWHTGDNPTLFAEPYTGMIAKEC